jgi:SPP1 family phage portal protein
MNSGQDDFLYSVNSLLALIGYDARSLTEIPRNENGEATALSMLEQMKQYGIINLDENGDAKFLSRGNFNDKLTYLIDKTREQIHIEGKVVDIERIIGATGSASGISLKLKYQPMTNIAKQYTSYFEKGLRRRVDLINILLEMTSKPIIENYEVIFTYNIPVNDIEIIQNIDKMSTIMNNETILQQLSFIKNPKKVVEAKKNDEKVEENSVDSIEREIIKEITKEEIEIILKTE